MERRVRERRRSRSRSRERRRIRSRSRERRRRSRSPRRRSRSPRRRSKSPRRRSLSPKSPPRSKDKNQDIRMQRQPDRNDAADMNEDDMMRQMMGFSGFDSTKVSLFGSHSKGKQVEGNDVYVAKARKQRKYRQYMHRKGAFGKPLDGETL